MFTLQPRFRNPLPHVVGHKDYLDKVSLLQMVDDAIACGKLDEIFVEAALKNRDQLREKVLAEEHQCEVGEFDDLDLTADDFTRNIFIEHSLVAFRCCIYRFLEGNPSVRVLSKHLAESHLAQWFCHVDNFEAIKPPSKSAIDRYLHWIPINDLDQLILTLIQQAGLKPEIGGEQILGLDNELALTDLWIDNTCLKANIHFPVDWVLLIDATRSLMKPTILIRTKGGLKNRMPQSPEDFISEMNSLAIAMSQARRRPDSKRKRKAIFRKMKKLEAKIRKHAIQHQELLLNHWEQTPWTEKQALRIVNRMQNIIDQLPAAIKQAHERIIGERQVKSSEKILSLYEPDVDVIVRGKAGADVEFGNVLALGEQADGLIVSWKLYQDNIVDSKSVIPSVEMAQKACSGAIKSVYGDRGTSSVANTGQLKDMGIAANLGARNIDEFRERMKDNDFASGQKRRAQTEGRIGIFKNCFLGRPLRMKGYENRQLAVSWAALTHDLWVVARIRIKQKEEREREEACKRVA